MLNDNQKQSIIESGKDFFRTIIIPAHLRNLTELHLKDFNVNPFLINYLAAFLCGNTDPESLAKALVYPRVLGTSINTTFGTSLQSFITEIQAIVSNGSAIPGIDIEFEDAYDGRKKYCQCKAGPQTINHDDVDTILAHFRQFKGIARTNRLHVSDDDLVVGVLYGAPQKLSANYKTIATTYPVLCGAEFWEHLTGDTSFYHRLAKAFGEVVEEDNIDGSQLIRDKVVEISKEIESKGGL
ncbi:MAG: PmeII family type II restriction endonuclease [Bacteroidales bacterium]|nr:PmeII family type II restriction endonuclease [Bacteroidales bacterium]